MDTMSRMFDEPQYESMRDAEEALEDARADHRDLIETLLEADVDDANGSVTSKAALREARDVVVAEEAVRSLTMRFEDGRYETLHKRLEKLRRGSRMLDEAYTDWMVFDRAHVEALLADSDDLDSMEEAALWMADRAGFRTAASRSRGMGDTFRKEPSVRVRGSRVLVTARGGLDV